MPTYVYQVITEDGSETGETFEHGADRARALVGKRTQGLKIEGELLVLRADAPIRRRFAARFQILDELTPVFDRCACG